MSIVFVPQVPSRLDCSNDTWMPRVDLSAAAKYGKVEVLLPPEAGRLLVVPLYELIRNKLAEFNSDEDWLVALGDPTIFAAAACYVARKSGKLRILKWDRNACDYLPVEIAI